MSIYYIRLIPTDPNFIPDRAVQENLTDLLVSFASEALSVEIKEFDSVKFIDQGEFFEKINCPICSEQVEITWWQSAMDTAYDNHFEQLDFPTPCCQNLISLNDLDYDWPAGFAKFVLEIEDPAIERFQRGQIDQLEKTAGCRFRQIWTRY